MIHLKKLALHKRYLPVSTFASSITFSEFTKCLVSLDNLNQLTSEKEDGSWDDPITNIVANFEIGGQQVLKERKLVRNLVKLSFSAYLPKTNKTSSGTESVQFFFSCQQLVKLRGPILRETSSETRSVCVKHNFNTRR